MIQSSHRVRVVIRGIAVLAAALAAVGCQKGGPGAFAPPPMPVEVASAAQGRVVDQFEAVGTIEAGEAITVVAEIDGTVEELPYREGQPIEAGGLIARLDDEQLRAEANRAEALRDQSRASYARVKEVVAQGAGAPQDLDDATAALKVAEANLALALSRLEKTRITAPFAGLVGARRVSPGAFVRAGEPITELAQIGQIRVTFSAPERYLARLTRGAKVSLSTTAYPGVEISGRIDVVNPVLDASTRTATVIARAANPERRFRPGMSAGVVAILAERPNAVTIPQEAVFYEGTQTFVYVVKQDSTVARSAVQLGTRLPDAVEVEAGVEPGALVVRAGHQKLFEGAKIIPIPGVPPAGGAGVGAGGATDEAAPGAKG